jgi:OmcA/MtrC family decaheme c-type cytochrome
MKSLRNGVVMALTAGALVVIPAGNTRDTRTVAARGAPDPAAMYTAQQKEHYLSKAEVEYIRPGLTITVNSVTIGDDRRPVVDLTYTDDLGVPLDRAGRLTPGAVSISFILSWWDPATRDYTAYTTRTQTSSITGVTATQAGTDSGGTFTDIDIGHSTYKFRTMLPADYDRTATTTLGIYATRNLTDIVGKNYYANVEYDFVPDGSPVTQAWDMISVNACNTCHNPLSAHGGARQDPKLCVLCHSPQTTDPDTGNTVNFKVMIHKIHMGENLPSVEAGMPYQIIGFNNSVIDFSTVVFPQDIRNCATCHSGPTPPSQAANWYTYPSRNACGACHDDVNFATGENHPGGAQADDSACASCHQPVGDQEFDASVQGAHTVPYKSTQLRGLNTEILSVSNVAPGQMPTVNFKITENDGTVLQPSVFGSNLNVLMGGPTADYAINPFRQRADGAAFNGTIATYTFTTPIPENATGTWTFSIECRRTVVLNGSNFTEGAMNPIYYASVDGSPLMERRMAVDLANCNKCHNRLALHGGQRLNTFECVMCHNPNGSDVSQRPADQAPPESIDFKRMIHRIHTGEELTQDFTIYGFNGSVNNFNEVRFPGDRRDCEKCHVPGAQDVFENPPAGLLPTTQTMRDWYAPMQHYAAACLGCHDTVAAAAHAYVMTAPFGEACAACHGPDADFAVDKVHAR